MRLRTFAPALTLLFALSAVAHAPAQEPAKKAAKAEKREALEGPEILPSSYPDGLVGCIPLSLPDTLRLAVMANLDVVQARLRIESAKARYLRARAIWLPNLNVGSQYLGHDGAIQQAQGTVLLTNRDSIFFGASTSFSAYLSDALFVPGEFRSLLRAAEIGEATALNELLFQVSDAYFAVLRARRRLARLDETLEFLTSEKESDLRGKSRGLLPLINAFVEAGDALPSDAARVEADVVRRMEERVRLLQEVRVASAELGRILHLPGYFFVPAEDYRSALPLPGDAWLLQPCDALVRQALASRPELAENAALVQAAVARYRNAYWRPLLPQVNFGYSYGGFAGGPELIGRRPDGTAILGNSRRLGELNTRGDIDVQLVWRLQNLGVGNEAEKWETRVRMKEFEVRGLQLTDRVITQVVQALEGVQRGYERVNISRRGLFDDAMKPNGTVYRALRLNFLRIRGGQGLPLEVLDSTRRLSDVLDSYANSLTDYDQARFRLLVAIGMPPEVLIDPERLPQPCNPPAKPTPGQPVPEVPTATGGDKKKPEPLPAPKKIDPPLAAMNPRR